MITGIIVAIIVIAMIVCGNEGEWGSVAVGGVIALFLIVLSCASRTDAKAYINFVDYWANGGPNGPRNNGVRTRQSVREDIPCKGASEATLEQVRERIIQKETEGRLVTWDHSRIESETLKARYAPIERSEAYKAAIERRKAK